jgi:hypothetical protein
MLRNRFFVVAFCLLLAGAAAPLLHADPVADLQKYSVFSSVDLSSLAAGKVLANHGPSLSFPRDISVQSAYVVHAPLARTLELHKNWDATKHSELKVYLHHDFSSHPTLADFTLPLPGNSAVRKLQSVTEKLPSMDDLQLSKAEAAAFKSSGGDFHNFWTDVLFKRASVFVQHGLSGQPTYDGPDGSVRVGEEVGRLLKEQPNVRAAFRPLIEKSPLGGGSGSLPLASYWELINEEGEGAFTLGAACSTESASSAQLLDLQYYASTGFYVYVTLYQMWPVTVDGKAATLVWRVDSISTLSVADLGPTERMGSGSAMRGEIQRIIGFFQKDTGQ